MLEQPVEQVGINAVGSLLRNPNEGPHHDSAVGRVGGIYIGDNFGSGAVGGILREDDGTADGTGMYSIVTDGPVPIGENGAAGGSEYTLSSADVTPDLLKDGMFSSEELMKRVGPEIRMMRSISHELNREVEEARTHRFITRLTWGSLAVVVIAVGLTLLWKWKPQNSTP